MIHALVAAVACFLLTIVDYGNLFVHPDNHQFILKESLRDGLAIGPRDLVNSMQLRAEGESRPRWLTYLLLSIDQKLRLWLYDWLPTHPTLAPVSWLLQLVVAPYCLYRLLVNLTEDRLAGRHQGAAVHDAAAVLDGLADLQLGDDAVKAGLNDANAQEAGHRACQALVDGGRVDTHARPSSGARKESARAQMVAHESRVSASRACQRRPSAVSRCCHPERNELASEVLRVK